MTDTMLIDDSNAPRVTLGGRTWKVPELGIRQLRLVRRPIIDLTDALVETADETTGERVMKLTEAQFGQMCDVVYHGLTRAHPELTREAFEAMAATDGEIFLAFLIVRRQSGIYVVRPADTPGANAPGEAEAEMSPTGTA
jgi:hypothetical protein